MTNHTDQPSPELAMATITAYQRTAAIKAAIELDVFSAIAQGRRTPADLAAHCQAAPRGVRILCDYLTILGFLQKDGQSYNLTRDSAVFLDRRSPAYLGSIVNFLADDTLLQEFLHDPVAYVRAGGSVGQANMAPDHPVWVKFARAMMPMMAPQAQALPGVVGRARTSPPRRVLDLAAGHGLFGIAMARAYPAAQIVAVDWAAVLDVAHENATKAGVANRLERRPGSAFDVAYGSDFDVVLLTNFLHHFDHPTCVGLLRKVHAALGSGGQAVALEFVPNDDRVSPPFQAMFSFVMLASTPAGDAYTYAELDRMFREAGFARTEFHPAPPSPQAFIIAHRD